MTFRFDSRHVNDDDDDDDLATSALDNESEKMVQKALDRAAEGRLYSLVEMMKREKVLF